VSDAMFSGWGVRTLADTMVGYNPVSYHNGSVWPHDSAICAAGLMRYGLVDAAHEIMEGVVTAATSFGNRLPELFAGLPRGNGFPFPVSYPTSCSPQAWAAASPLLMLRSLLHFEPEVRHERLYLAPAVPEWIGHLSLHGIALMGGHLSIEVEGDSCRVLEAPAGLTIVPEPRPATHE
jgi:glycogen debranching enzyme